MHTYDDHDHERHVLRGLAGMAALGALLAWSLSVVVQVHRRRTSDLTAPLSERLHTWEGEGGRPTAAGQPEVTPDLTP